MPKFYLSNRNTCMSTSIDISIKHDLKRGNTADSNSIRLHLNMNGFSSCNIALHKEKHEIQNTGKYFG